MYNLWALIRNENMKLFKRPSTWVLILIYLVIIIPWSIIHSVSRADFVTFIYNVLAEDVFVCIMGIIVAGGILSIEFSEGTIKLLMIRPIRRWKILFSKYVAVIFFIFVLETFMFSFAWFISFLVRGLPPNVWAIFAKTAFDTFLSALENIFWATISFFCSVLLRNPVSASIIGLIAFAISPLGVALDGTWIGRFLFFTYSDLNSFEGGQGFESLGYALFILTVYWLIFLSIAFYQFTRRDIST